MPAAAGTGASRLSTDALAAPVPQDAKLPTAAAAAAGQAPPAVAAGEGGAEARSAMEGDTCSILLRARSAPLLLVVGLPGTAACSRDARRPLPPPAASAAELPQSGLWPPLRAAPSAWLNVCASRCRTLGGVLGTTPSALAC
jgi:hypothetical protein